MKLERIIKSDKKDKKFTAIFCLCKGKSCCDDSKKKKVNFGSAGMDDYTITKDKEQRNRYRARHKKDLETGDPTRAGYLSFYILWGDSTSIQKNIELYKKKFNL